MKSLILTVALCVACATPAFAKDATPQQNKMAECNKDAGEKKGDERKAFMKTCLSAKKADASAKKTAQQEKMKACNADEKAKTLKGADRKAFMKECLSK